jgi:hypothetical protein
MKLNTTLIALSLAIIAPQLAQAELPVIQTQGPIIHLADNLNEAQKLGWCIDTEGRCLNDQLHAHSCKPTGEDVRFSFSVDTGIIRSVSYELTCMAYSAPDDTVNPFGLLDCVDRDTAQQFTYDDASMEIRYAADPAQCVAVGAIIDDAGPYQSRDLILASCTELEPAFNPPP